jgi:hypothetical protein
VTKKETDGKGKADRARVTRLKMCGLERLFRIGAIG